MNTSIFAPITVGGTTLVNRICFPAHRTNFSRQGRVNDRHIAYYRRRAQGGCGLIVLGELSIHAGDQPWESMLNAFEPPIVRDLRRLADAVHPYGTKIFAQLTHHGFQSSGAISRQVTWGPSAMADIAFGETCKAMEVEDMATVAEAFAAAAVRAREGGMDGLEIDMGCESLLRQFLSPISNHRQDEFGGSLAERIRFPLLVMAEIRKAVGRDFTVGVLLSADEKFWGGISLEESFQVVKELEVIGNIDFCNVDIGTYYNLYISRPSMLIAPGQSVEAAVAIKAQTSLPVMTDYQLDTPEAVAEMTAGPPTDLVGLLRPLICDPDLPRKGQAGKFDDIRCCIRDNQGCVGRVAQAKSIGCTVNATVGNEPLLDEETSAPANRVKKPKKILVAGGGPAGLEAARVAALRGHQVTVYEKGEAIGGQINLLTKRPGREGVAEIIRYFTHALAKAGVTIKTGTELTVDQVLADNPDAVIVATGSKPRTAVFAGNCEPPEVLDGRQVLGGRYPVGERVVYIDESGGREGASTVEWLADQGKKVRMITNDPFIGVALAPIGELNFMRQRLLQKGVVFFQETEVVEIGPREVVARDIYSRRLIIFEDYDTVVIDAGSVAENSLYLQLKGRVKELYHVGDAVAPRGIEMAIWEASAVGNTL